MSTGTMGSGRDAAELPTLPVEDRGKLTIGPAVVEKVAAQAVHEVADATGTGRRFLGRAVGSTTQRSAADVRARVDALDASVRVDMTVVYPASVQQVTRRVREHITERVLEITGVSVRQVDITVVGTAVEQPTTRRVK